MEKKKKEFALMMFFGWLLIAASLVTSGETALRDVVQGIMTGMGIGIMLLALWMFRKNNGFKSKE